MAWDDTKQADDLIASSEWNSMVTDQKSRPSLTDKILQNQKMSALAELQFDNSRSEIDYTGGFMEIFRDKSKIINSSNLTFNTLASGDNIGTAEITKYSTAPNTLSNTLTDATSDVYSVAFNDNYLAVAGDGSDVYIYDTTNFNLQQTLTDATSDVNSVDLSQDGELAVGSFDTNTYVYDTSDFSLQYTISDTTDAVNSVAFSGSYLAVGTNDNNTYVYNRSDYTTLDQTLTNSADSVIAVAFSNDGSYLAAGTAFSDNNTYVYDTSDFSLQYSLTENIDDEVTSVDFTDGFLAVGKMYSENNVYIYDTTNFNLQETLTDSTARIKAVAFSNDGSYLAVGNKNNNVLVYSTTDYAVDSTLTDASDNVLGVDWTAGYLAGGSADNNAYIWVGDNLFYDSGSVEWSKDLSNDGYSNPPSKVVSSWKVTLPTDTSITVDISDGTNTITLTETDFDKEVDLSDLTSTSLTITANLSQSTTNDDATPTLDNLMLNFEE